MWLTTRFFVDVMDVEGYGCDIGARWSSLELDEEVTRDFKDAFNTRS